MNLWKRPVAIASAAALMFGTFGLSSASAVNNYPDEASEAAASIVASAILGQDMVGAATTTAGSESAPGPDDKALDASLLGDELIDLGNGISVPLTDVIDFGKLGAVGSKSEASSPVDASAVSGLVSEGGSITLSGDDADFGAATIDLLSIADKAGVKDLTDLAIDEMTLKFGAFGAEVVSEDGKIQDPDGVGGPGQYRVGEASLLIASPVVDDAANGIYGAVGSVDTTMEQLINDSLDVSALTDLLSVVPGIPEPTVTVESNMQEEIFADLLDKPLTSTNKIVTIDFSTGELQIHLDQLADGGINAQEPNKELLASETYPLIAEGVHDIMRDITNRIIGAVEGALDAVTITLEFTESFAPDDNLDLAWEINLGDILGGDFSEVVDNSEGPLGETLGKTLAGVINTLGTTISPILAPVYDLLISDEGNKIFDLAIQDIKLGFTGTVVGLVSPAFDITNEVFSVQVNHQTTTVGIAPDGTEVPTGFDLSALSFGLVQSAEGGRLNFGNAAVRTSAGEPIDEADASADASADPETDADADASASPEADADADASADPEADMDADASADPEADADASADPEADADADSGADPEADADADSDGGDGSPAPTNDVIQAQQGIEITFDPMSNDEPGAAPLVPGSTLLDGDVTELTVEGEGTYVVDTSTGEITFTPVESFLGVATPVTYLVVDEAGMTATATVTIVVSECPPGSSGAMEKDSESPLDLLGLLGGILQI